MRSYENSMRMLNIKSTLILKIVILNKAFEVKKVRCLSFG